MLTPELLETLQRKEWFYDFDLPGGHALRSRSPSDVTPIHSTRLAMLMRALAPVTSAGWGGLTAIDIACHQGFFTSHLARNGCASVLGVDARQSHVEDCALIAKAYGLANVRTLHADLFALDVNQVGSFDITLLFGLLYHVENPVGALRLARVLTKRVCVVETQVAPNLAGPLDWGSYRYVKMMQGSFALIDETEVLEGPEMSITGICLCPSVEALMWMMRKVGFTQVELISPPADAYEQHLNGKRVVVAGYV